MRAKLLSAVLLLTVANAQADKMTLVGGTVIDPGSGKITPRASITTTAIALTRSPKARANVEREGRMSSTHKASSSAGLHRCARSFLSVGGLLRDPMRVDLTSVRPYKDEVAFVDKNLRDTFARYLRCGITSVVDVGGPMTNFRLPKLAKEIGVAPRIAVAGPLISSVARPQLELNGDAPIVKIDTPEQGVRLVQKLAKRGPDYVKIWYVVSPESPVEKFRPIVHAVIAESHRLKCASRSRHGTRPPAPRSKRRRLLVHR